MLSTYHYALEVLHFMRYINSQFTYLTAHSQSVRQICWE